MMIIIIIKDNTENFESSEFRNKRFDYESVLRIESWCVCAYYKALENSPTQRTQNLFPLLTLVSLLQLHKQRFFD